VLRSLLRRFAPRVSMVKSSQSRSPYDPGVGFRRNLRRSPNRRVAKDRMNAFVVVVVDVFVEESLQMPLVDDNHVIEKVALDGARPAFCETILPR
jgi:hypothetical protein